MALTVLGSSNLDHVHRVARIPAPGETVLSEGYATSPGGKGLNQAVAAGRTSPGVEFVTALGRDEAATGLLTFLEDEPVAVLARRGPERTGSAQITVDAAGENAIVVDSGANAAFTGLGDDELAAIDRADALLLQLELPLATVTAAAERALASAVPVVLNAAPVRPLDDALLALLDVLIVNEHEARELAGGGDDAEAIARALTVSVPLVVMTLGGEGAVVADRDGAVLHSPAFRVGVVDTTGAGDTFCGAFAAQLAEAFPASSREAGSRARWSAPSVAELVRWASAAAALSVGRAGAAESAPSRSETEAFLAAQR